MGSRVIGITIQDVDRPPQQIGPGVGLGRGVPVGVSAVALSRLGESENFQLPITHRKKM